MCIIDWVFIIKGFDLMRIAAAIVALVFLSGCEPLRKLFPPEQTVTDSVAQQVLGVGAFSVYPFARNSISAPGIYTVRTDENSGRHIYNEVCSRDMNIPQIANVNIISDEDNRTYTDILDGRSISVATPFIAAETRYTAHSVDGYTVRIIKPADATVNAARWILENVDEKCKELLNDGRNYFVVVGTARSNAISVNSGGGITVEPFNIAGASVSMVVSDNSPKVVGGDRVFAISGLLFRNGVFTTHGPF